MGIKTYAQAAANWAVSMVGCEYSQAKRLQDGVFDCSSLVARAYKALGKRWKHGDSVPISIYEVYDDDFELLWPENYADIGKKLGGKEQIALARQAGDLQFLCTDKETKRTNRITHVAMVAGAEEIVHARGTKYGVRMEANYKRNPRHFQSSSLRKCRGSVYILFIFHQSEQPVPSRS